jgi:hypothetical protein
VIVVLGRPALGAARPGVPVRPDGTVARVALAAAASGAAVELVGTVGDDERADALTVALGRAGVGHAALLRVPGAATPTPEAPAPSLPRLEAADVDLGLRYVPDCRVLVLAEPLSPGVTAVALDAAAYHGASVVAIVGAGSEIEPALDAGATVLAAPGDQAAPFAELVGRYAARLDAGVDPGVAFAEAVHAVGWEPASAGAGEATV